MNSRLTSITNQWNAGVEDPSILYLGDGPVADEHCRWLGNAGLSVRHATSIGMLEQVALAGHAAALVVDLSTGDSEIAGIDAIVRLKNRLARPPRLIFLSDRADQEIRLRAVRAGGEGFLINPVTPAALMQHLEPALLAATHRYRLLLIGETPGLLSDVVPVLQQLGMLIKRLDTVSQALLTVINFAPDLIMIEQELSCCRGDQLGRMFHQLADYEDLPVIYLVPDSAQQAEPCTDHASETVCPGAVSHHELVNMIDRMAGVARVRKSRIHHLQTSDAVTGLLNQHGFLQRMERSIVVPDTVLVAALVLIDVEDLQVQHPQLSPQAVNRLMAMFASQLAGLVAPAELLARIGDYCFACLIQGRNIDEITQLGEFLGHSLSSRILDVEQYSLTVGCNIGVAVTHNTLDSGMPLVSLAQQACKEVSLDAASHVRIRTLQADGGDKKSQDERQLLSVLRDAVEKSYFRLVYQPIASLRGSVVENYEVLLRLGDDGNKTVSPSRFIPLAERYGLMREIDRWVVQQTIKMLGQRGKGACFFVKVSLQSLGDPDFVPYLKDCLERFSAAGNQLVCELGVDSINDSIRQAAAFSRQIISLGCGISIEHRDASEDIARLLEHIPAMYVKLGGDMIRDLEEDHGRQLQLDSVVQQCDAYDVQVIAGFVESAACLKLLWQSGVHYIQGNFLQEPDESLGFDFGGDEP